MAIQDIFYSLDQMGFTDVFLPFVLIYTILFAILQKIELFGSGKSKKFNAIIALALAIGVIIPHSLGKYPPGTDVVQILNQALPNVSLLIVGIIFVLIIIGMFGGSAKWGEGMIGGMVTIIAIGLVVAIFGNSAGWWQTTGVLNFLQDPDIQAIILVIGVFWIIISTITKEDTTEGKDMFTRMGKFFGAAEEAAKPPKGGKPE